MVAAFDYCLHGKGGAAPSIDTAMHGLVDAAHVDHLHPDAGIAFATAADGEALTKECFGDRVVWVPWRRPGLPARAGHRRGQGGQPAGDRRDPRRARHHRVGRHERRVRGQLAGDHPHRAGVHRRARPARAVRRRCVHRAAAADRAARAGRRARAAAARAGLDRPAAGRPLHRRRRGAGLPGPGEARQRWPRSAPPAPTTSCAPRCARSCSTCRRRRHRGAQLARAARGLPRRLRRLLRAARRRPTRRRCAAPTRRSCSCPASACSATARTSRPPGWPASSTSTPST